MTRLRLVLKANADVYDALHASRLGGEVVWNGVDEVVSSRPPGGLAGGRARSPRRALPGFQGFEDILSTKVRRFKLGLIELSEGLGISVVDVDGALARAGAARLRLGAFRLTPDGCRVVAEEVVRVLADLGLLPGEDAR